MSVILVSLNLVKWGPLLIPVVESVPVVEPDEHRPVDSERLHADQGPRQAHENNLALSPHRWQLVVERVAQV